MEHQQRTTNWFRARLGKFTGSQVGKLMGKGKGCDFSKVALDYIYEVAAERALNKAIVNDDDMFATYIEQVSISNKNTRWGTQQEPFARELFEKTTGRRFIEVSSISHPTIPHFASSPDGFEYNEDTEKKCTLEIKCPTPLHYIEYTHLLHNAEDLLKINPIYYYQCFAHMMCTGSAATEFIAYNPFMEKPLHHITIEWNEKVAAALEERIRLANRLIDEINGNISI